MEFEILNDILTQTVDETLGGAPKYFTKPRKDPQGVNMERLSRGSRGDKVIGSFISRGDSIMSRDSEHSRNRSVASNQGDARKKKGSSGADSSGNPRRGTVGPQLRENCTVEEWLQHNAPLLLKDSLRRLNVDLQITENRNLDLLAREELLDEKRRVKNELKRYDSCFDSSYNRFPNRNEKEPMRPLYIYYKRLKQAIAKAQATHIPQTGGGDRRSRNRHSGSSNNRQGDQDYRDAMHQLERLKKQRAELRKRLEDYQVEFIRNHNRRIRYRKDILEVEEDYNLYKSLKEDIRMLENRVRTLRDQRQK